MCWTTLNHPQTSISLYMYIYGGGGVFSTIRAVFSLPHGIERALTEREHALDNT